MATYRGGEIPVPMQPETDLALAGPPVPGLEDVEEGLNMPEEAGPDHVPMPGGKGYMGTKPMAELNLPNVGSNNIEDRRGLPIPEQGEGREPPSDEEMARTRQQNEELMRGIQSGSTTVPTYEAGPTFGPQRQGPEFDSDFEPRRRKYGSDTVITPRNKFHAP